MQKYVRQVNGGQTAMRQPLRELSLQVHQPCLKPTADLNLLEQVCHDYGISVSYPDSSKRLKATAGTILQSCASRVSQFRNKMNRDLCVYKLGITAYPPVRFLFYKEANYTHMTLLHVTENLGVAQMLEASLISSNLGQLGCRNERLGGEGPPNSENERYHFVYIVGARADCMKPIG